MEPTWYLGEPLALVLTVAAIQYRLKRSESATGALFWHFVSAALVLTLAAAAVREFAPQLKREVIGVLLVDFLRVGGSLALIFATELRPDSKGEVEPRAREEDLHLGSAISFLLALLIYCAVIPSQRNPDEYLGGSSSVLLFLCLAVFFVVRFAYLASAARSPRWRLVYAALGASFALSALFGALELRTFTELGVVTRAGAARWDPAAILPLAAILVAARGSRYLAPAAQRPGGTDGAARVGEPLAFHAIALPLLHLLLDFYGKLAAPGRSVQHGLVIVYFLFFGALALIHGAWREKKRRAAEQALAENERLAALGRFSGAMAHKIRNPLAAIVMTTFFLEERLADDDEGRGSLADVKAAVERMQKLVDGVVAFVRPGAGRFVEEDLVAIAESARRELELETDLAPVDVVEHYRHRVATVRADVARLADALGRLFDNAARAMPDGGTLTLATRNPSRDTIELTIEDTGVGILEKDRERIFEPFFTHRGDGVGLGLALAARVLEQHRCSYRVESEPGVGTRFILEFPLVGGGRH